MWFDFRASLYIYLDLTFDMYFGEKKAFLLTTGQKQEPVSKPDQNWCFLCLIEEQMRKKSFANLIFRSS